MANCEDYSKLNSLKICERFKRRKKAEVSKKTWALTAIALTVVIMVIYFAYVTTHRLNRITPIFVGDVVYVTVDPSTGAISDLKSPNLAGDLKVFPDGRRFVYSNLQWKAGRGGLALGEFTDGKVKVRQLTHGQHLAPCPSWDQKKIVFTKQHQVAILDLTSNKVKIVAKLRDRAFLDISRIHPFITPAEKEQLYNDFLNLSPIYPIFWAQCVWTRDDRGLLCVWQNAFDREQPPSLWYISLKPRRKPVKLLDRAGHPAVNPKNGTIAFVRYRERQEHAEVWLGRFSPKHGLKKLQRLPIRPGDNIAWSPDGQKIAFIEFQPQKLEGELCIYELKSGSTKRVAGPNQSITGYVSW